MYFYVSINCQTIRQVKTYLKIGAFVCYSLWLDKAQVLYVVYFNQQKGASPILFAAIFFGNLSFFTPKRVIKTPSPFFSLRPTNPMDLVGPGDGLVKI